MVVPMNKKLLLVSVVLLGLMLVPTTAEATKVTEIETKCEIFECYTILEITELLPSDITLYKNNLGNFITKKEAFSLDKSVTKPIENTIKMDSFVWDTKNPDLVTIRGTIKGATSNYWGISDIWNSTWWNSSEPYCQDIVVLNGQKGYPAFINVTNGTDKQADFDDVRFVNASCNNTGGFLPIFQRHYVAGNWSTYDIVLDGTQNISMYFGNSTFGSNSSLISVWGSGVVVYHTFDNDDTDLSGENNGMTIGTAVYTFPVSKSSGLLFDGNDNTDISDSASLRLTSLTIMYEFNTSVAGDHQRHVSKWETNQYAFGIKEDPANVLQWLLGGVDCVASNYSTQTSSTGLSTNTLYWVVGSYNETTGNQTLWINGGIDESDITYPNFIDGSCTSDLNLGHNGIGSEFMTGKLDEVIIWNKEVEDEILVNFYAETKPTFVFGNVSEEFPAIPPADLFVSNISYTICVGNTTELTHEAIFINGTFNYTDTYNLCLNGCNNDTIVSLTGSLCNPDVMTQYVVLFLVLIGLVLIYKWVVRR